MHASPATAPCRTSGGAQQLQGRGRSASSSSSGGGRVLLHGAGGVGRHGRAPARRAVRAGANTFGTVFTVTTFGESHGGAVGCVIDGVPPRVALTEADIQPELNRRKPGQSRLTTPRKEDDEAFIVSGTYEGRTLGTPVCIMVKNKDQRSGDYTEMEQMYRPSHSDATYDFKYGIRAVAGGGRSSARETIGRVAAGAVAKKVLAAACPGLEVLAWVSSVGDEAPADVDVDQVTLDDVEDNICRAPTPESATRFIAKIDEVRKAGDSIGGIVTCVARGVPKGLGAPVFAKLEADLAAACLSLPAVKGFEVGSGFAGTRQTGSSHNDEFFMDGGEIRTRTNRSGGIQGGITNGETIVLKVAFKPTSTIGKKQNTVRRDKSDTELIARGRHDPCVVPRAVPMVEAMTALVLVDQLMRHHAQCGLFPADHPQVAVAEHAALPPWEKPTVGQTEAEAAKGKQTTVPIGSAQLYES